MNADLHIRAKELLVAGGDMPAAEQRWLEEHLAACADCAAFLDRAHAVRAALHSTPLMADPALVDATRRRALRFAAELGERENHRLLVRLSIGVAAVLAWMSVPLLWQAAQWVGAQTTQPQLAALLVFLGFGLLPAVLAIAAALAARQGSAAHQVSTLHSKGDL